MSNSKRQIKVKVELEVYLEDLHDLDMTGFAYMQEGKSAEELAQDPEFDEIAQIKLASILNRYGDFVFTHITKLKRV